MPGENLGLFGTPFVGNRVVVGSGGQVISPNVGGGGPRTDPRAARERLFDLAEGRYADQSRLESDALSAARQRNQQASQAEAERYQQLQQDPIDAMLVQQMQRRAAGSDVPYNEAAIAGMFTDANAQGAEQARVAADDLARRGASSPDALRELEAGRQAAVQRARLAVDTNASQANYAAKSQAQAQLAATNAQRNNMLNNQLLAGNAAGTQRQQQELNQLTSNQAQQTAQQQYLSNLYSQIFQMRPTGGGGGSGGGSAYSAPSAIGNNMVNIPGVGAETPMTRFTGGSAFNNVRNDAGGAYTPMRSVQTQPQEQQQQRAPDIGLGWLNNIVGSTGQRQQQPGMIGNALGQGRDPRYNRDANGNPTF